MGPTTPRRRSALVAILVLLLGCQSRHPIVPQELVGVWKTLDERYADRSFEVTKTNIVFYTGHGQADVYPIAAAERAREGDAVVYTILYLTEAREEYRFTLYFEPGNGGVIRWKQKPDIAWAKARSSP